MSSSRVRNLIAGALLPACLLLVGCPDNGPAESTGDAVEEFTEDVGDLAEDAGDTLGEAADSVKETAEEAADSVKETAEDATGD